MAKRERGCYVVERPDAEELALTKAWWSRYNFTDESSPGVMAHSDQSFGLLAWFAYEREVRKNKQLRKRLKELESR